MKTGVLAFCLVACACPPALAQDRYSLPACSSSSASKKLIGGRIKLHPDRGALVTKGQDVDYSDYAIGFGPENNRVWLEGIYGPNATSGKVREDWLRSSVQVTRRSWTFADLEGVDVKGKLANGNYWRYLGQFGESINYFDVPAAAAAYFDTLLDGACFLDWRKKRVK